tara:strand:- start:3416 stop:3580 length:165 start_codon:yes stop_codon:yes gene_type:complete
MKTKPMSEKEEGRIEEIKWVQSSTGFDDWLDNLEDKEQPEACSIDNPDCENCGS